MEAALFKGAQFSRWGASALGRNHKTFLFFLHGLYQRLHGLNRRLAVAAIDEDDARGTHQGANKRQVFELAFTHPHNIPADQTGHDQHVGITLVVEHEDRRAPFPEMFPAPDIQV